MFWKVYYSIKIFLLKFKYPKAGKAERTLLAIGYKAKDINQWVNDYPGTTREEFCKDELFYVANDQ